LTKVAILNLIDKEGLDNIGMFTFTFAEDVDYKEASRRWDSFNRNVLRQRYSGAWVKVLELTKKGRPHYHVIVVSPGIRIGADIRSKPKYGQDGKPTGKKKWWAIARPGSRLAQERRFFAETCPRYGFGSYNDISPILASAKAAANYAAKYVVKSFGNRPESLKGARLVSFGKGVKPGTTNFSSRKGKAARFRQGLKLWATKHGTWYAPCPLLGEAWLVREPCSWEDLRIYCDAFYGKPGGKYVGHRWAYFMREEFEEAVREFERDDPF
jgi:hypothetical protein